MYKSEKIKTKKFFVVVWLITAIISGVLLINPILQYIEYYNRQTVAIDLFLSINDEFDEYSDNRSQLVEEMYDYFHPHFSSLYTTAEQRRARTAELERIDKSLGSLLVRMGVESVWGKASGYFEYSNIFDYAISKYFVVLLILLIIIVLVCTINLFCVIHKKSELTIDGKTITARKTSGKVIQFFAKDIKSVETTGLKGLKIKGNGIRYKIILIKNANELKSHIMDLISENETKPVSTAQNQADAMEALKKAKELLDEGIITEEEFAEKKKQLLGL